MKLLKMEHAIDEGRADDPHYEQFISWGTMMRGPQPDTREQLQTFLRIARKLEVVRPRE